MTRYVVILPPAMVTGRSGSVSYTHLDVYKRQEEDAVVAARELDLTGVPSAQRNWLNDHTVFTHGYGVVVAYGTRRGTDGEPVFIEQDIPTRGKLGEFEPRIYFCLLYSSRCV